MLYQLSYKPIKSSGVVIAASVTCYHQVTPLTPPPKQIILDGMPGFEPELKASKAIVLPITLHPKKAAACTIRTYAANPISPAESETGLYLRQL
jgi:hypothetical protein